MDQMKKFTVKEAEDKKRIDKFLAFHNEGMSRSYLQKLIKEGKVKINEVVEKDKSQKIEAGDEVELIIPEPQETEVEPEDIPLNIIYEDKDLLVVNKQPDLVVHPAPGHQSGTLVNGLLYYCDNLSGINGVIRPGVVHRLDKDTSGALVIAKSDKAHLELARQFKEREVKKVYLALVQGRLKYNKGKIDAAIGRDSRNRKKMAVTSKNSKRAVSRFEVIERYKGYTLVKIKLETGRTHQIRVHMEYIKHPVVGDELYGHKDSNLEVPRQMLHAQNLGFYHPRTESWQEYEAPLFEDMKETIKEVEEIS